MVDETVRFIFVAVLATAAIFLAAASLTSCSELKYAECIARDNTRNPCQ